MKKSIAVLPFLAALLLAAPAAHADGPVPPPKQLAHLVGRWMGTGRVTIGSKHYEITMKMRCTPASGGWGVLCRSRMTGMPGIPSYLETDLFGWNQSTQLTHWYAVTNTGQARDRAGTWTTPSTLVVSSQGKLDGRAFVEHVALSLHGAQRVTFRATETAGGKIVSVFTGTFERR